MEEERNLKELVDQIKMYKVASSNVAFLGYDIDNMLLKVIFKNDSSYLYENVSKETWGNIINSPSKGKALVENITRFKEKYKYTKL